MFDRALFKSNAKTALKRFYGTALLAALIVSVITGIGNNIFGTTVDAEEYTQAITEYAENPTEEGALALQEEITEMATETAAETSSVKSILNTAFTLLVVNILSIGTCYFYLRAREYNANVGDLFNGYKKNFGNNVLTMFLVGLKTFLWSLLFLVPGIIKAIEYSMVPYILAENPNVKSKDAFKLSRELTNGYKWELFVLDLSFIGWTILGLLCCGIGVFFLEPYINATKAEAYTFLKARAIENGRAEASDFPGVGDALVVEA